MRFLPHFCALLLGVGAALLTGCGDRSKLIPASDAGDIKASLTQIRQAVDSGDCGVAKKYVAQAQTAVQNLPTSVDPRLKSRLLTGIAQLSSRSGKECAAQASATTQETIATTAETTAPETTTTTDTTTSDTTTTDTTTTDTTQTDTTTDPGQGGGASPTAGTTASTPTTPTPDPGGATPPTGTDTLPTP